MNFVCLISARNLGDAVLHSSVLLELSKRNRSMRFIVWTRPQSVFLFNKIPNCEIITSPFPLGTGLKFNIADWFKLLKSAIKLRNKKPQFTLDLIGDFRERILALLIGSKNHIHIGWSNNHHFHRLIRNPFGIGHPLINIDSSCINIYHAYSRFIDEIAPFNRKNFLLSKNLNSRTSSSRKIGIHPFASQECKLWDPNSWRQLIRKLRENYFSVIAFSSPAERDSLIEILGNESGNVTICSGTLNEFEYECDNIDLLIGLDSFSVHMAQRQGVSTIVLNAGNPSELWCPPDGVGLGNGGGCKYYPCFNVPKCNYPFLYTCIKSISVDDVLTAVFNKKIK